MKLAVVINVGTEAAGLAHAVETQSLLLEHMGARLHSIRLALPHLFEMACREAMRDEPDVLAVAGGPRSIRRAGQIAYEYGIPIFFLPGLNSPSWAKRLWNSLTLEQLVAAIAKVDFQPVRFAAGFAGTRIFFDTARCGVLPQIAQLRHAFEEAETVSDDWNALGRVAGLGRLVIHPGVRLRCDKANIERAMTLTIRSVAPHASGRDSQRFHCTAWTHRGLLGYLGALFRAGTGKDWRKRAVAEHFDCARLSVDAGSGSWLVLDEEPITFQDVVEFRFVPGAIQTFRFSARRPSTNDNGLVETPRRCGVFPGGQSVDNWNLESAFNVRFDDVRKQGRKKEKV